MSYINVTTSAYPLSEREIREAHPNTSFADPFQAPGGYAWVFPAPAPTYDHITQFVREIAPADTIKGHWEQQWEVLPRFQDFTDEAGVVHTAEEQAAAAIQANQLELLAQAKASYTAALDAHFLETAKAKGYDSQYTCALRAGYPGPFHDEGVAFATWMDNCNIAAYTLMNEVLAGQKPMPSLVDFIAGLPVLIWPGA